MEVRHTLFMSAKFESEIMFTSVCWNNCENIRLSYMVLHGISWYAMTLHSKLW